MVEPQSAEARAIGEKFYGKEMFVVITEPAGPDFEIETHGVEHIRYQIDLEKQGIMFAAGPLTEEGKEWSGVGLFILRAKDFAEAKRIADADPLHRLGIRTYTLRKWRMNEGRIAIAISLSDSSVELV